MEYSIEDDSFMIVEKPKKVYKGFYKDGKPYKGYFSKGDKEFPRVDYYENGVPKFQYSLDIMQMFTDAESTEMDLMQEPKPEMSNRAAYEEYTRNKYKPKLRIKSIYENGEIIDGYEYEEITSGLVSKKIENKKIKELHIDVFAMHYYERNSIILKSDRIVMGSPTLAMAGEKFEVSISKQKGHWIASYTINDKEIGTKHYIKGELGKTLSNTVLFIYDHKDKTYGYGTGGFQENSSNLDLVDITSMFLEQPEIFDTEEISIFFQNFVEAIISQAKKSEKHRAKEPEIFRGYLVTGNEGNIIKGIRFFEKEIGSYYVQYKEGKEVVREKTTLLEFQEIFKKYLNSLQ
ncbi:hypothetical protein [Aquimarina sp. SS2-1]|uniref:hypothetical protein n=1 Tax=Aquimarina besae TaxID=3342247 RepID=UPI00366C5CC9